MNIKTLGIERRKKRVRLKIVGSKQRPRLSVFRSNYHIFAQLIDDSNGKTMVAAKDSEIKEIQTKSKSEKAFEVGKLIAQKASELNIKKVVFDKNGYKYHGSVKAIATGAREGGLKF